MELSVEELSGGLRCVKLAGRLDLKGTQEVDLKFTALVAGTKQSVIVDMAGVDYIASIGIRMFISNVKALASVGAKMIILKPQKMVDDVLRMAGLDAIIPIHTELAAATEAIKGK
ncbi:MAG: STAS domain-containing protein [Verrucomicrobia bacterium]|nr:STAS domain-containing protein [Verrucomicrobiota bacterium]